MNIPKIASIEVAVELYYGTIALYTEDVKRLFPGASDATVSRLKKVAREHTRELGRMLIDMKSVPTEDAYEAWGLNIDTLEAKYKKMKRLGLGLGTKEAIA